MVIEIALLPKSVSSTPVCVKSYCLIDHVRILEKFDTAHWNLIGWASNTNVAVIFDAHNVGNVRQRRKQSSVLRQFY